MQQLDLRCAEKASEIINTVQTDKNKIENLITKSLGVLQEDGIYAFFLYLEASKEKDITQKVIQGCKELLKEDKIKLITKDDILEAVREELASDIDKLLLAKQLLERTLVYVRYHTKALVDKPQGE
ncbi:MAG: hypothetical protein DRP41_01235 [Thermodesulfobacteriota bacterium]|nr:MAG: hypothetical protein DRP41_01235 [Thermodesulfobacteriota bacterium]